jgi:uncharacterized protein (UPF0179 family)
LIKKETDAEILPNLAFLAKDSFEIGERWTYLGNAVECAGCEHEKFCHAGLSPGDTFLIIGDRGTKIYCALRDSEVTAVVTKKEVIAALQTKIVEVGITTVYDPIRCDFLECPMADCCLSGPSSGVTIKIEEILRTFDCQYYARRCITMVRVTPM